MSNAAAERPEYNELMRWLAADFFDYQVPSGYLERIDAALAAERKATVERIRAAVAQALATPSDNRTLDAILDAEAER